MRIDRRELQEFLQLTGLRADESVPMLYPHVVGFPLQMVILTHPSFPLPIWNALQIRNRLLQHRPIPAGVTLEMETRVAGQRILEKGAEFDVHTAVRTRDALMWESLNTYYYRGRFGVVTTASPLAAAPEVGDALIARWRTASRTGLRFGRLTGDYNGIHLWSWYARMFGFRRAFHHPQSVLGQCLARLPAPDAARPQRLDAWLKGPVYYGAAVALRASIEPDSMTFALTPEDEVRPAVSGRWSSLASGSWLEEEPASPA